MSARLIFEFLRHIRTVEFHEPSLKIVRRYLTPERRGSHGLRGP